MTRSVYRPELDSLRAIAIVIVMLHHYVSFKLPMSGIGVMLFFVLSGYFGTRSLLGLRAHREVALRLFYGRRYLRILPPHLLVIGLTALFAVPFARETWQWNLPFLANVGMMVEGEWFGRFSPLWSLSLLEQFYLFWPSLILFVPERWLERLVLGTIAVALIYRVGLLFADARAFWWLMPLPAGLDQLGAGALLALWQREGGKKLARLRLVGLWLGGAILLGMLIGNLSGHRLPLRDLYVPFCVSLFFVWLTDRTLQGIGGPVGWVLKWRVLAAAGQASYAAFLFHNFTSLLLLPIPFLEPILTTNWRAFILVPATFLLAQLSWVILEKPLSDYRKRRFATPRKE